MGGTAVAERAWCVVVPHHARGARVARYRLASELGQVATPELLADAVAVIAELVGNAIRHAQPLPGEVIRVAWKIRTWVGTSSWSSGSPTAGRATSRSAAMSARTRWTDAASRS